MARKNNGGMKLLKITGGVLLILGGVTGFSKYIIDTNFLGTLISAIALFFGIWLIGQMID